MPELPEVDMMVQKLRGWIRGGVTIGDIQVLRGNYLAHSPKSKLVSQKIKEVARRGKFIVFELDNYWLVGHNAMSGFWDVEDDPWTFDYVEGKRKADDSDVRVKIVTIFGRVFRYHDARLFGSLRMFEKSEEIENLSPFKKLGPEAILTSCSLPSAEGEWNVLDLATSVGSSKRPIKEILMDQSQVAGIGNIYANEGLWLSGVDPARPGKDLRSFEVANVHGACQRVLRDALERKLDYSGLKVYRREVCSFCSSGIVASKIKGRGTYRCPKCQP